MLSPAEAAYRKIKETCSFRRCRRARPRQLLLQHAHECPPGCPVDIVQACRKPLLAGSRHAVEDHQDERARYAVESERSSAAPTNVPHSWKFRTNIQIPPRGPSARTDTPKTFPEHRTGKIALCAFIGKEAPSIGILTEAPFSSCYARLPPLRKVA